MSLKLDKSIFALISLLLAGCSINAVRDSTVESPPEIITATLPPTSTPYPTETPLPPPPTPTSASVDGFTSTPLNVRREPSTASEVLGIISANSTVQITGKDIGGNWWQIIYEAGGEGKGWVTAQYVETGDSSQVPVIGGGEPNPFSGSSAVISQQLNVRSGPGTSFSSLGVLNANDVVNLTAKNGNGSWLQIEYPAGPGGKGWISSGFVKVDEAVSLPIVSESGEEIGTGTPADTPLPATPTLIPAQLDFDSADSPIKTVILGGAGAHTVLYNGDVSFPEGDTEDWISVTPQEDVVFADVKCLGSDSIRIEIVGKVTELVCNEAPKEVPVSRDLPLLIHIEATGSANQLQYTSYILTITASP